MKSNFFITIVLLMLTQAAGLTAQEVSLTFRGESLSEALRQIDHAQSEKHILFLFDDLEMYDVTAVIDRLSASEAVRKVCGNLPVAIVEDDDNIFVEYIPRTVHLHPVVVNGDSAALSLLSEKVFLRVDSTSCLQGETIRFTADVLPRSAEGQRRSRVLYVDLLSSDGALLQQQRLPLNDGPCHGAFELADTVLFVEQNVRVLYPRGTYQLRAYTRQSSVGSSDWGEEDGLVLDGWVVDRHDRPLEGVIVTAAVEAGNDSVAKKVRTKTNHEGYWCFRVDDFFGTGVACLTLDGRWSRRGRIVVRQSLCYDLMSQLAAYRTLRTDGTSSAAAGGSPRPRRFVRCFDVQHEEDVCLALGLKSVSVADLLTEKGLKCSVEGQEVSYSPNEPPTNRQFYTEVDYGNIESAIQRKDQTDGIRFWRSTPSYFIRGTYVNGHPARWSIKVPRDFPSKIYEREINYTWGTDIKYVKSILLLDYEPVSHPYVEVWVVLRDTKDIGKNALGRRTVRFSGFTSPLKEETGETIPREGGDHASRRFIRWTPDAVTDSTGCATTTFYIGEDNSPAVSAEGLSSDSILVDGKEERITSPQ